MASTPQFIATPNVVLTKFANADGTTAKTIFTAGSSGSRVTMISVAGNNDATIDVNLYVTISSVNNIIAQFSLPLSSGSTKWIVISMLDPDLIVWLDRNEPSILLPSSATISLGMGTALTSGRGVDVVVFGGDF